MKIEHVYHLYRRAGFGILPEDASLLEEKSREEVVRELFRQSRNISPLAIDLSPFDEFFERNPNATYKQFKPVFEKNKELRIPLNRAWMERICNPKEPLRERMTLFWANIFVCQDQVVPYAQQFNNTLRKHALGNFKDLVKAISREPAMIRYLNTNRNKKDHPNENFARELMELFTLGTGNYSEEDIKESARAFTGYSHFPNGTFRFLRRNHDFGIKEFFGFKGNLSGDDVINIITNEKQCAQYICSRIYRYFVNEEIDPLAIDQMVATFYPRYEISDLMTFMLKSDWFYADGNRGNKLKSPMDLMSSIYKAVPFQFTGEKEHIFIQRLLGQVLFNPPNVAGWKGGKSWIDTNTILARLKLPSILFGKGRVPYNGISAMQNRPAFGHKIKVAANWSYFDKHYGDLNAEDITAALLSEENSSAITNLSQRLDGMERQDFCIQLMSTPEFQLT